MKKYELAKGTPSVEDYLNIRKIPWEKNKISRRNGC